MPLSNGENPKLDPLTEAGAGESRAHGFKDVLLGPAQFYETLRKELAKDV